MSDPPYNKAADHPQANMELSGTISLSLDQTESRQEVMKAPPSDIASSGVLPFNAMGPSQSKRTLSHARANSCPPAKKRKISNDQDQPCLPCTNLQSVLSNVSTRLASLSSELSKLKEIVDNVLHASTQSPTAISISSSLSPISSHSQIRSSHATTLSTSFSPQNASSNASNNSADLTSVLKQSLPNSSLTSTDMLYNSSLYMVEADSIPQVSQSEESVQSGILTKPNNSKPTPSIIPSTSNISSEVVESISNSDPILSEPSPLSSTVVTNFEGKIIARMKEAFSKVTVTLHITKCGISGPSGTGKTHFREILLNRPRPKQRKSTSLSTKAKEVTLDDCLNIGKNKSGSLKWTLLKKNNWARLLANTIYNSILPSDNNEQNQEELECDNQFEEKNDLSFTIYNLLQEMYAKKEGKKKRSTMNNIHLLYIVDVGGQPQFQEILPNFVHCSINFLVHNLSQRLDDCPQFEFVRNGQKYTIPDNLLASNLSIIKQSVHSVCSFTRSEMSDKQPLTIAIVGTFKDKFEVQTRNDQFKPEEELTQREQQIETHLKKYLKRKPRKCVTISSKRDCATGIFTIDASEKGWDSNCEVMETLKNELIQHTKKAKVPDIPISYFVFFQNLKMYCKKNKKHYLCISDLGEVNKDGFISLTQDEINKALCFFSDVNLILYFPRSSKVSDIIFFDPSFLYDRVTDIIVSSFSKSDTDESNEFYKTGIITARHLDNIPSLNFSNCTGFTKEMFLSLLQDLFIIAALDSDRYFMPCVLPLEDFNSTNDSNPELTDIKNHMDDIKVCGPLVIAFADEITPRGLFCAMVTKLSQLGWQLNEDQNAVRCRNMIEFSFCDASTDKPLSMSSPVGTVLICDKVSHFELYTTCEREHCPDILSTVNLSIYEAGESLKYRSASIHVVYGFRCQKCEDIDSHHTSVSRKKLSKEWIQKCSKYTRKRAVALDDNQIVWFESQNHGMPQIEVPISNLREVMNELIPNTNKWYLIGLQLDIRIVELERLERNYNTEECFSKMIDIWQRNSDPSFTWNTIVNVLTSSSVRETKLAKDIENKFIIASPNQHSL